MTEPIPFAKSVINNASLISREANLERIVTITNQSCIIAVDKALAVIYGNKAWCIRACLLSSIAERISRAVGAVGACLPVDKRTMKRHEV